MFLTKRRNLASGQTGPTSLSYGTGQNVTSLRRDERFSGSSYTQTAPGTRDITSSCAVSGFMATRKSISFLRATYPFLLARMVYQVGRPAMFEGNRFLPETGTPIWKMLRSSTVLADCDPEPLTVATWMLKSFTLRRLPASCSARSCMPASTVAMKPLRGVEARYEPDQQLSPHCMKTFDYRRVTCSLLGGSPRRQLYIPEFRKKPKSYRGKGGS